MKPIYLRLFFVFFLFGFFSTNAQYTDVINSNKPGFSESPYAVGTGVYQFESNLFLRNTSIEPTFSRPQSFGTDLLFRVGFLSEKLELNTQLTYQRDKVAFKNIFTSQYFTTGLSRLTFGAKYLVFQQKYTDKSKEIRSWKRRHAFDYKRFIPSVAVYMGINTDAVNDIHKVGKVTPKIGLLLQNNLSRDLNIVTNFFYDNVGTEFKEMSYIITVTQNISDRWSTFFENQGVFQKYQNNNNIGLGLAYLFTKNLQINTSARYLTEGRAEGFYTAFGLSYRIDKHQDSFKNLDENGKEIKDSPITRYNKKQNAGFFSRIFGVFKKKNSKKTRKRSKRSRKRN
ncbi:transporter [Polaribacter sp. WD7]|uniref:transporter n=1 Tax=Polaribacter sp. WD7 TaxID=2269061 RepID=UPI000DF4515E|nr:transporter [Polaribacter sp. WD7]RCS28210.1 transporter [Polaribacter sp. WD7]